jgi:hypothetical protein
VTPLARMLGGSNSWAWQSSLQQNLIDNYLSR